MTTTITTKRDTRTLVMGVLSYLGPLCFIPLLASDRDEFILFHGKQGVVLWGMEVCGAVALLIPGAGRFLFSMSETAVIVLSVIGILSVLLRKAWRLPVVYRLARAI